MNLEDPTEIMQAKRVLSLCPPETFKRRKSKNDFIHTRTLASFLTIVLLQSLLPCCQTQDISSDAVTSSAPVATSPVTHEHRQSQQTGEGFFVNGSSYAVISETLKLDRGSHIGFSFRTCTSGELVKQTGGSESLDEIRMFLNERGSLVLALAVGDQRIEQAIASGLNDAHWHTVVLRVAEDSDDLTLSVTHGANSSTATLGQNELGNIVRDLDLRATNPQLRVGAGLVACIREGPGVRFTKPSAAVNSVAVEWGRCLLEETCSGYNWAALSDARTSSSCDSSLCQNGGICLPRLAEESDETSTGPICLCPPGFTSPTCALPMSTCAEGPCRNNAPCTEDPSGGTGYECQCSNSNYQGRHCEVETPRCVQNSCQNGGVCLNQPAGFLCECTSSFSGLRCENPVRARSVNPCLSGENPCQNGGTCMYASATNSHTCNCGSGFTGRNCETDLCLSQNCPQNSVCIGGTECKCLPGFQEIGSGVNLSCEDIDECLSNPCNNGGACINLANGFRCQCPNGFNGTTCDEPIDYCLVNNRCLNGATCRNLPESASIACDCPEGFEGVYCQDDVNECAVLPAICLNNAQCQNFKGSYACSCEPGWSGIHCEINIDECLSGPCQNNAICNDLVNAFQCVCTPGFEGLDCSVNIDECANAPCLNGGACNDEINNFTCSCTPQFMGPTCETAYNACVEQSCQNGGQCIVTKNERDPGNDFYCECPQGFNGLRCENNVNECEGVVCTDNKICVDLVASYECRCPQGFAGDNCSVEIDECLSNPCQNGATCIDRTDGFDCRCSSGWSGVTCSEDLDECALNENLCNNGICRNTVGSYECYCRPGFSGNHCNHDFDECLSRPCQNDGACSNLVNSYQCTCAAGFEGVNCEVNIDECESNSCQNNATCVDGINNFTCSCQPGFTGRFCETNINECESSPCLNKGSCIDGINSYVCLCEGTGFKGQHCEINIDECLVEPCQNNATCIDGINEYTCICFDGYGGKNCDQDISECMSNPCMNNASCYEFSNTSLYRPEEVAELPMDVRPYFEREFSYFNASGYVCGCLSGFEGVNCETDIDECLSAPCLNGMCVDGINEYICNCNDGYEGTRCEHEIDECDAYLPCENGICIDRIADYYCQCNPGYGGKNCSVALTGCESVACLNGGTCTPWLVGETDHRANCTCTAGFDGLRCQSRTTFSLSGLSYIKVPSDRSEGYELHMKFRTTIGNGLVAIGQGNTHFSLQLRNGKLNLHSNLISKYEGIIIGENLNNTKWQKVYVAVNSSHLTLGVNDQLQATQPINPTGDNDTVFFNTFIGGIVRDQEILANNAPSFTGCIQDIVVNEMKITEEDFKKEERGVEQVNTEPGCLRKDQCNPNPCQNEGTCEDLWSTYKCTCHRPFLGTSCQYNYTAATFGYENTTNSIAFVDIAEPAPFRSGVDISMFIRTREESGFIFYFGSDLHHPQESYITGQLVKGNLVVNVTFDGKTERFQVYTVNLSDGDRHFIRVVRMNNSMMVKVNETVSINHEIPSPTAFSADKLYLGNFPTESADLFTPPKSTPTRTPLLTSTTTESTTSTVFPTTTPYEDQTTVVSDPDLEPIDDNIETTLSPLSTFEEPAPEVFTTLSTQPQQPVENDSARFNEIVSNVDPAEETETERDVFDEVSASPIVVARRRRENARDFARREQSSQQNDFGFTDLQDFKPPHFKGVIQDIRISDGGNVTRIVELFRIDFDDVINVKPQSIGEVHLINVKQGVISDNTCRSDPCLNGGTCHVTWNDYSCECPEGYKGRNCTEKEYCYWFVCPNGSECVSLIDGHECVANATFNGVNSTVVLRPNDGGELTAATITVTFRTQRNGTLLHILGADNKFIRMSVQDKKVVVEVPEKDSVAASAFGRRANDGKWHTVVVRFVGRILTAYMDNTREEQLSLDLSVDLNTFMTSSEIIVGASHGHDVGFRDQYQLGSTSFGDPTISISTFADSTLSDSTTSLDIHTSGSYDDYFRGCIGEVRIGGILVPFFTDLELVNSTASKRFIVESRQDVSMEGCVLCYEQECQNSGVCQNPGEVFQCQCPNGFEDEVCSTNIDECISHGCINGFCQDGIANYTCTCLPGWTGWLCDEDFDECLSNPCKNNGSCEQTEEHGNYTCTCPDDFKGHNCQELKIKTCEQYPCKNGGTCKDKQSRNSNDDLYSCDCTTAYKGVDCEIKKDFCEEFQYPCQNGATCISIDSTFYYKCLCMAGFTGDNCGHEIDECDPNPCDHGRCEDKLNGYECDCNGTGFEGSSCSINIDECLATPCVQGNCSDTPGSYHCDCLQGYCGTNCQREDPCQLTDGLCKNEGQCIPSCDEPPFYQCACSSEWEGHNCTIKSPRRGGDIALIVGPVVGGILFIAVIAVLVFLIMARKKRKSEGKYKPATQELTSPRLQLDNIIKPPPEERLI